MPAIFRDAIVVFLGLLVFPLLSVAWIACRVAGIVKGPEIDRLLWSGRWGRHSG
jgi:hypothetical protein